MRQRPSRTDYGLGCSAGFTYPFLLLALAIASSSVLGVFELWSTARQRELARQTDWSGKAYCAALISYFLAGPGSTPIFPQALSDLVRDNRYLTTRRHLRVLYPNPYSGRADWEPIAAPAGGIMGVRVRVAEGRFREYVVGAAAGRGAMRCELRLSRQADVPLVAGEPILDRERVQGLGHASLPDR